MATDGTIGIRHVQVTTAAGSRREAENIVAALLALRLVACGQIVGPVQSRYLWRGRVESAEEWLCIAKTTTAGAEEAMAEITRLHSYETPEITVTPIIGGSPAYLAWIDAEVAPAVAPAPAPPSE